MPPTALYVQYGDLRALVKISGGDKEEIDAYLTNRRA